MLMSKSRLEKFLYALYSLDSSDLPKPLSRIEELYKCLVTGEEAPTFEPLSRVEKYLMAILGVYDVDSLPNPLSRVEVLLHKLATGDDNLDDVESFQSEHEELLAEIIRNGGVGGDIDIEYVVYTLSTEFNTLYNTAEKPVRSAVLKGSTKYRDIDTGDILDTFDETKNLELVSVKMPVLTTTGKNLFDTEKFYENVIKGLHTVSKSDMGITVGNPDYINGKILLSFGDGADKRYWTSFKTTNSQGIVLGYRYTDGTYSDIWGNGSGAISAEGKIVKNIFMTYATGVESTINDIIIEEYIGNAHTYEPYKTNILTTSEDIELRGIGDVRDELDLLTGELAQRIGEVVYDGTETLWKFKYESDSVAVFQRLRPDDARSSDLSVNVIKCDKLPVNDPINAIEEGIRFYNGNGQTAIGIDKSRLSEITNIGLRSWLQSNPVTVVYPLAAESVKTADLSVVNQGGNNTKLSTFNDITHVTLSSEGLIPEAEMKVAMKNEV